jgi:hypothetical protein
LRSSSSSALLPPSLSGFSVPSPYAHFIVY